MIKNKYIRVGTELTKNGKHYIVVPQTEEMYKFNAVNLFYTKALPIADLYCIEDKTFEPFTNEIGFKLSSDISKDVITTTVLKLKLLGRNMPLGFNIYEHKGEYIYCEKIADFLSDFFVLDNGKYKGSVLFRYVKEDALELNLCLDNNIIDTVELSCKESDFVADTLDNGYLSEKNYILTPFPVEKTVKCLILKRLKKKLVDKFLSVVQYIYKNKTKYTELYFSILMMYNFSYFDFQKNFINIFMNNLDVINVYEHGREMQVKNGIKKQSLEPVLIEIYNGIQYFFQGKNIIKENDIVKFIYLNCTSYPYLEEDGGKVYPKVNECLQFLNIDVHGEWYENTLQGLNGFYSFFTKSEFLNIFHLLYLPTIMKVVQKEDYVVETTKEGIKDVLSRYI